MRKGRVDELRRVEARRAAAQPDRHHCVGRRVDLVVLQAKPSTKASRYNNG